MISCAGGGGGGWGWGGGWMVDLIKLPYVIGKTGLSKLYGPRSHCLPLIRQFYTHA